MPDVKNAPPSHTVLVVDDDPSIVRLCVETLRARGFTVLEASGSPEALKLCSQHPAPIHLLIADLFLPPPALQLAGGKSQFARVHGHELVHHIIAAKPETRVLLMSAYSTDELKEHGIVADSLPFLRKPFTPDALAQAVEQALNGPPVKVETKGKSQSGEGKDVEWFD